MSFDLEVTFSGLILLVPNGPTEIWALLIKHKMGGSDERHVPSVLWPPPFHDNDPFDHRSIEGQRITLEGEAGNAADARALLRGVSGNLTKIHGVKAKKKHAGGENWLDKGALHAKFGAWVRLVNPSSLSVPRGRCWRYGGQERFLATHVTVGFDDYPQESISVALETGAPLVLKPSGGTLPVGFFNVPELELSQPDEGTEPPDGFVPPHFHAFAMLFGGHTLPNNPPPAYINPQPADCQGGNLASLDDGQIAGINPYHCLTLPICPDDEPDCDP